MLVGVLVLALLEELSYFLANDILVESYVVDDQRVSMGVLPDLFGSNVPGGRRQKMVINVSINCTLHELSIIGTHGV